MRTLTRPLGEPVTPADYMRKACHEAQKAQMWVDSAKLQANVAGYGVRVTFWLALAGWALRRLGEALYWTFWRLHLAELSAELQKEHWRA